MEITDVRVFPVEDEKLKAFASIVFDKCFMVNDIKVIRGKEGLFISMPSRKKRNGEFKDIAHPLNQETRKWVEARILAEYEAARDGSGEIRPVSVASPAPIEDGGERTLEQVEQAHLDDAFWGVGS